MSEPYAAIMRTVIARCRHVLPHQAHLYSHCLFVSERGQCRIHPCSCTAGSPLRVTATCTLNMTSTFETHFCVCLLFCSLSRPMVTRLSTRLLPVKGVPHCRKYFYSLLSLFLPHLTFSTLDDRPWRSTRFVNSTTLPPPIDSNKMMFSNLFAVGATLFLSSALAFPAPEASAGGCSFHAKAEQFCNHGSAYTSLTIPEIHAGRITIKPKGGNRSTLMEPWDIESLEQNFHVELKGNDVTCKYIQSIIQCVLVHSHM